MSEEKVLIINPGSTSTKVSVFQNGKELSSSCLDHIVEEISVFDTVAEQFLYRKKMILDWLKSEKIELSEIAAVMARGGLLKSVPSGVYEISEDLVDDMKNAIRGEHASNLGAIIAKSISDELSIKSYIADPVAVDEMIDIARISGNKEFERLSFSHALNIRAVAHRFAREKNTKIEDLNLIVAHLGGGISVVPLKNGRMIDTNNANAAGPFSPERTGTLPVGDLVDLCFSSKFTHKEMKVKIKGKGGLTAYLGTNDVREVSKMIESGDKNAENILNAMSYQIAKEIGAYSTTIQGNVDAIILTGGISYSEKVTEKIKEYISFIAPVVVLAGEDEMNALYEAFLRLQNKLEKVKIYEKELIK